MLYALLCYNDEDTVWAWDKKQDGEVMARLGVVRERLEKTGKMGPSLRLLPTTKVDTAQGRLCPPYDDNQRVGTGLSPR